MLLIWVTSLSSPLPMLCSAETSSRQIIIHFVKTWGHSLDLQTFFCPGATHCPRSCRSRKCLSPTHCLVNSLASGNAKFKHQFLSEGLPGPLRQCCTRGEVRLPDFGFTSPPSWGHGKESVCRCRRLGFYPSVRNIPWRRKWQPTLVFLPGESHGPRSLVGYSPWGYKRFGHNLATNTFTSLSPVSQDTSVEEPSSSEPRLSFLSCKIRMLIAPASRLVPGMSWAHGRGLAQSKGSICFWPLLLDTFLQNHKAL